MMMTSCLGVRGLRYMLETLYSTPKVMLKRVSRLGNPLKTALIGSRRMRVSPEVRPASRCKSPCVFVK